MSISTAGELRLRLFKLESSWGGNDELQRLLLGDWADITSADGWGLLESTGDPAPNGPAISIRWFDEQRRKLVRGGMTDKQVDAMGTGEFAAKVHQMVSQPSPAGQPDKPDEKPDSGKKIPRSERILRAISYVNGYRRRVARGDANHAPLNSILSMHLDVPVEDKRVDNLARQLREYRHLLADK